MLKRKKIFIAAVVLVLMLAIAVTVYATSYTCSLYAYQTGAAYTASITTAVAHSAGFNQPYSEGNMEVRLQLYAGGWISIDGGTAKPNKTYTGDQWTSDPALPFRTKIYASSGQGGVEGVGSINNY